MRIILAPMEGVIDHTMRNLLTGLGGIDRCVTEFVRVSGQLLPSRVFHRYCPELGRGGTTRYGTPVYLQLLGGQPGPMGDNAARAAELGAPGIDLNFGCPAKTVNRSDGGAIILRQPERVYRIVSAVRRSVPDSTPVTVKTRLGFDDASRFTEIVAAVADAGATELAVHARTRQDGYRPPAHWDQIAIARSKTSLPLIANGEIWNPADALRCRDVTGCEALMLGRGALCRPDLPRLVQAAANGIDKPSLHWHHLPPLLLAFFELNLANYDARYAGNPVKQWLVYLRSHYPQAAPLFESVKRLRDPVEIDRVLRNAAGAAMAA